jgi:hypothetical protein
MEKEKVQNLENHTKFVPAFHMFMLPVFLVNLGWRLYELKNGIGMSSVMSVLFAAAFLVLSLSARIFALTVQDRVIRLEMQLRLERLLSADLRARIAEFTVAQLVSLRFAGDDELPALARQVLDEKLTDRKAIKSRVKNWRPDFLRA